MRVVYLLVLLQLHWVAAEDVVPQERATSNVTALEVSSNNIAPTLEVSSNNTATDRNDATIDDLSKVSEVTTTLSETFEGLGEIVGDKALNGLSTLFQKLGPALGIAGALLSAFLPDGNDQTLKEIQKKLKEMDGKLTSLGNQIDGVKDEMIKQHGLTRLNDDIKALFVAREALDVYLNDPKISGHVDAIKELYTDKALLYEHIKGTYGTLNGQIYNGKTFFEDMYTATNGDWSYIQKMNMHFQTMLVKSIATYTLGCKLKGKSTKDCEGEAASLPGVNQKLQTSLDNNVQKFLMECRTKYVQNRKVDVEKIVSDNSGLSNQKMADKIAKFVRKKYFWKDQTVVVYNVDVIGDSNHAGNGGLLLEFGDDDDQRIRILDGDTVPNTFSPTSIHSNVNWCDIVISCDIKNVYSIFGGTKGRGWYRYGAKTLREGFESQLKDKGFNSTQTTVIQKSKTVVDWYEKDVEESDTNTKWNLGKNGKMIVGGTNRELHKYDINDDSTYYYFFIQLKDREFSCEGEDSCCGEGYACGIGEGDCDTDSDCISGILEEKNVIYDYISMFLFAGAHCGVDNCKAGPFSTSGIWDDNDDCCQGTYLLI